MRTIQVVNYALRLGYSQAPSSDKAVFLSAAALATIGLTLSTFSVKQMVRTQRPRF